MTTALEFRALAGQSRIWLVVKTAISLVVVTLAAFVGREGFALAIIIVFMGVTGPAIRLVTMKMGGIYDRIIVSPVSKPRFFLKFARLWSGAVLLPLVPSIAMVVILAGPAMIILVIEGTVLAVVSGTLAGFVSRGLSDAHVAALLIAGVLIALALVKTPITGLFPYAALVASSSDPEGLASSIIVPVVALIVLALAVSRS
jgi:hypothetical protein